MSEQPDEKILLSNATKQLFETLNARVPGKAKGDPIEVSEAASFVAFAYEKLRSAIEFTEEHLFRRAAIARVLRRRLGPNPSGKGEGENIIRELLWGNYFEKGSLSTADVQRVQQCVDAYLDLLKLVSHGKNHGALRDYVIDLLSCEIEELLNPVYHHRKMSFLYFFYQTTKEKVLIEGCTPEEKDQYHYVACEQTLLKNDKVFVRYHLLTLQWGKIVDLTEEERQDLSEQFRQTTAELEKIIENAYHPRLSRKLSILLPPFRILFDLIEEKKQAAEQIVSSKKQLYTNVKELCIRTYGEVAEKLKGAGWRSIIYIFATKMVFVLLIELPLTTTFFAHASLVPIAINTITPPLLMALIVLFTSAPGEANTKTIQGLIEDIIDEDSDFETQETVYIALRKKNRRPILFAAFTAIYTFITIAVFSGIYLGLELLEFTIVSKAIFIFFVSVIMFFGFRIRQIAREYTVARDQAFLAPVLDTLALPLLSFGKLLSSELSRFNILILFFDVVLEAPFKLIVEVVEEWIRFTKGRREEIL